VRELREETGLVVAEADLVGPVFAAADAFAFDRWWIEQSNFFFAVRVPVAASPREVDAVPGEVALLQTRAWWTLDQLRAHLRGDAVDGPGRPGEPVYPPNLPDVVEAALAAVDATRSRGRTRDPAVRPEMRAPCPRARMEEDRTDPDRRRSSHGDRRQDRQQG
jgi:hypothetical protein